MESKSHGISMISYIVCKWQKNRFEAIALPGLKEQCDRFGAELIIVQHPTSIFHAYEKGRNLAKHEFIVYLHEDVAILDPDISKKIVKYLYENKKVGLLGVLGSMEKDFVPWWDNNTLMGHIVHPNWSLLSRLIPRHKLQYMYATISGKLRHRTVRESGNYLTIWKAWSTTSKWDDTKTAGFIDGMFIAERQSQIPWDTETYSGWHCYDYDRALQIRAAGFDIVISDLLLLHLFKKADRASLKAHRENLKLIRKKWDLRERTSMERFKRK